MISVYELQHLIEDTSTKTTRFHKKQILLLDENGDMHSCEDIEENTNYSICDKQDNTVKNWIYLSVTIGFLKHLIEKPQQINIGVFLLKLLMVTLNQDCYT